MMSEDQVVSTQDEGTADSSEERTRTFRQADVDRIVGERLKREVEKQSALEAELSRFRSEAEERARSEMTELQRIQSERDKLAEKLEQQKGRIKSMEIESLRNTIIGSSDQQLPGAYRRMVTGENEDDIRASLESVIEEYKSDMKMINPPGKVGTVTQGAGDDSDAPIGELSPLGKLLASKK